MNQSAEDRIIWAVVAAFMVGWLIFGFLTFVAFVVVTVGTGNAGYGVVVGLLFGITAGLLSALSVLRERLSSRQ